MMNAPLCRRLALASAAAAWLAAAPALAAGDPEACRTVRFSEPETGKSKEIKGIRAGEKTGEKIQVTF